MLGRRKPRSRVTTQVFALGVSCSRRLGVTWNNAAQCGVIVLDDVVKRRVREEHRRFGGAACLGVARGFLRARAALRDASAFFFLLMTARGCCASLFFPESARGPRHPVTRPGPLALPL